METPVIAMILKAGWMGRTITFSLVLLSFVTWAIIFNRFYVLSKISSGNRLFRKRYSNIGKISEIENLDHTALSSPMAQLGRIGATEFRRILEDAKTHTGVKDWSFFLQNQFSMAADRLESTLIGIVSKFDKGVLILAMTASISPFIGLLGTVWGITNSFYEIGNQGSASLPVVAPGIAEALITTMVGLAVAIPALFFYNYFNHRAEKIEDEMDEFREVLMVRMKREIFGLLFSERPSRPQTPIVRDNSGE